MLVAPILSKTNLLFKLNRIYHMQRHSPPDRFGLPPNYRWIHGHPPDPPILIGVRYTHSGHTVTVTQDRFNGCKDVP